MNDIIERSGLSESEISRLRVQLCDDRTGTTDSIETLKQTIVSFFDARRDTPADDEHDPEGSTISLQWAESAALLAQARHHLDQINVALAKIPEGDYGVCESCGRDIPLARLTARPYAAHCVLCAA